MLETFVKACEHQPRLVYPVARSRDADVVAPLFRDHAQPARDQGEVLTILAEQDGSQSIIVECEHKLSCGIAARRYRRGHDRSVFHSRRSQRRQSLTVCASCTSTPNKLFALTSVIFTGATL